MTFMKTKLASELIQWDTVNWSKALDFWENEHIDFEGKKVLELGAGNGGLSLWCALKGAQVVCSDVRGSMDQARNLHIKYGVEKKINYESIDATNIQYDNFFDIVIFKSVIGGIGFNNHIEKQRIAFEQIEKSLKPGGKLLFAENLVSSPLHKYFRKKFVKWGKAWRYVSVEELNNMLSDFINITYKTVGFLGTLGRNEEQRCFLGNIDNFFDKIVPKSWRYIGIYICEKKL